MDKGCSNCAALQAEIARLQTEVYRLQVENRQLKNYISRLLSKIKGALEVLETLHNLAETRMREGGLARAAYSFLKSQKETAGKVISLLQ